jgi:ferredoxin/flavodoxin
MANIIFCFSATGNSLTTARDIAERIGDTKIVPIAKAIKASHVNLQYERIGFVFPVYYISVPPIIRRFIARLDFDSSQYIFAAITAGVVTGQSFTFLSKFIEERGGCLNAAFPVQMPGNNINLYDAWPVALQCILNKRAKKKTAKIAGIIKEKRTTPIPKGNILFRLFKTSFIDTVNGFSKFAKDYRVNEKCTGCGTCARICPIDNITMTDKKPVWGNNCEHCTACIQWCPAKAIDYKGKTSGRKQYRHPEVKLTDLLYELS